jgi:glycosyltransferases involved in cell wall biogenesis
MTEKLYIIIPAYNEKENIVKCVVDWYAVIEQFGNDESRLVIVDDGSKDNTLDLLQELKKNHKQLIVLKKENGGHGSAVLYGYNYAIDQKADWVFQTDSDGQTNPKEFGDFWAKRTKYDALIGIRTARKDGLLRKSIEKVVCIMLFLFFGIRIKDANAPFRLMKSSTIKKYIKKLPKNFNIPNIMMTTYFVYFNESLCFLPISFKAREKGKNSVNLYKIFQIGWRAIGDFIDLRLHIYD